MKDNKNIQCNDYAYKCSVENKLSFTTINNNLENSVLELFDTNVNNSVSVNIPGKLRVNKLSVDNIIINRNTAKIIRVGNVISNKTDFENNYMDDVEPSINNNKWHLIEIRVYNNTGSIISYNVSENANVTLIKKPNTASDFGKSNIVNGLIYKDTTQIRRSVDGYKDNITYGYEGTISGEYLLQIELPDRYTISHIELYNRYTFNNNYSFSSYMDNTIVELIDITDNKKLILNRRIYTGSWIGVCSKTITL
jgi:hypothetical protein